MSVLYGGHGNYNVGRKGGVEKTSMHLGDFKLFDAGGVEKGRYRDLYDADLREVFDENHTLRQERLPLSEFLDKGVSAVGGELGRGGFGIAYRCKFRECEYVIKLPKKLVDEKWLHFGDDAFLVSNMSFRGLGFKNIEEYVEDFEIECKFNEMAVDSYKHRELRSFKPGTRLLEAKHYDYVAIKHDLDSMKCHEGYEHVHKILGFVPGLPAIFSEPCSGSLQCLVNANSDIFLGGFKTKLSYQWLELARQIGNAIEYLKDIARVAHLDIKPGNILYNESKDENGKSVFCWKLSDFGLCQAWDDNTGFGTDCLVGTLLYLPKILKNTKNRTGSVCFNAYDCSLHSYMATLIMSIKFDIERNGVYLRDITPRLSSKSTSSYIHNLENFDVVDHALSVLDVKNELQLAKENGSCLRSDGQDHVFCELAKMFFSDLSEKPDLFTDFMASVSLELKERKTSTQEPSLKNLEMKKRQTPTSIRESSPILLIAPALMPQEDGGLMAARRHRSSDGGSGPVARKPRR